MTYGSSAPAANIVEMSVRRSVWAVMRAGSGGRPRLARRSLARRIAGLSTRALMLSLSRRGMVSEVSRWKAKPARPGVRPGVAVWRSTFECFRLAGAACPRETGATPDACEERRGHVGWSAARSASLRERGTASGRVIAAPLLIVLSGSEGGVQRSRRDTSPVLGAWTQRRQGSPARRLASTRETCARVWRWLLRTRGAWRRSCAKPR